ARGNPARGLEARHPAHRAGDAHPETLGRRIARHAAVHHCPHNALAKIVGKRHPRRLLRAAKIMNQNSSDSGIPQRFTSLGYRSNVVNTEANDASPWRARECSAMKGHRVNRRSLLIGMAMAPAVMRAARAAPVSLRLSSSLPNNPKFANGRVYYDNLVKHLAADGLADRIDVQFFPDNQLGQEIDVVNSVSLGVIDLMVTTSIWANVV